MLDAGFLILCLHAFEFRAFIPIELERRPHVKDIGYLAIAETNVETEY